MDNYHEPTSNEKQSASSSEGRRKKRPSLILIRNSATRKSEHSEKNLQSHPINLAAELTNETEEHRESGGTAYYSFKSENEFNLRTPSEHNSVYSSPRTPRSSPKDFESDTPFIPFVHQSLTRTVWESEEIIPEEKEDIERKESQTQFNNQKQALELESRASIRDNPEETKGKSIKKELEVSLPLLTTILPSKNSDENNEVRLTVPFENEKESLSMEVTHEEYVSKAPIFYQQEMIASVEKSQKKTKNKLGMIHENRNWEKFSFSYLESISVRPVIDCQSNQESLSENKIKEKFQISNPIFEHIKCSKKHNVENQTNFSERLQAISKAYEEKIGFETEILVRTSIIETIDQEIQTEQLENPKNHIEVNDLAEKYEKNPFEIEKETKEEKDDKENQNNQQLIEKEIKVLKNFACQYDQNDVGIKPSIKRVSIADSKNNVIFDIDSNNSTITCEMDDKKNENKKKEKKESKSKPKDKAKPQKGEPEPIEEKIRKSKRNLSRNVGKKARA